MMDLLPPERWRQVNGVENPADCASRGIFPTELVKHNIWWSSAKWLLWPSLEWPKQRQISAVSFTNDCVEEVCYQSSIQTELPIIPLDRYSDYHHLNESLHRLSNLLDVVKRSVEKCRRHITL